MIRTHKPAGAIWTCASQYQQGKEFRKLDVADCTPPPAKVLCPDSDDELSGRERASKRRRIEKLASGFFDGKPLFIPSACASGVELKALVRTASKGKTATLDGISKARDGEVWADEKDGWEVLQAHAKRTTETIKPEVSRRSRRVPGGPAAAHTDSTTRARPPEKTDKSPTSPKARPKRPRLSTKPSEEALAKAAELRARNRRLSPEMPDNITVSTRKTEPVTHSAPPTARANPSFRQVEPARRTYPQTPADETLADELRLSRTESPSRRPRALAIPPLADTSFSSNATVENTPGRTYSLDNAAPQPCHGRSPGFPEQPRRHAAVEQQVTSVSEDSTRAHGTPTNTGSTAMDLCTVQGSGWTAINGTAPVASLVTPTMQSTVQPQVHSQALAAQRTSTTPGEEGDSSLRSTTSAAKATSARRRRKAGQISSQNAVDPTLPHNQQRLMGAFRAIKADYINAPASQSGTTPFQYRRKAKAHMVDAEAGLARGTGKVAETNTEDTSGSLRKSDKSANADMACATPKSLQISTTAALVSGASAHTPNVDSSLMAEHLNHTLPKDNTSRSSSLRRALRAGMRLSGAQIERAPGEPPSSQVTNEHSESTAITTTSQSTTHTGQKPTQKRKSAVFWPGTQVLLDQAQQDLFISPEKSSKTPGTRLELDEHELKSAEEPPSASQGSEPGRLPLRPPSQECALPSTQALMGEWSPWSTVKKPNAGKRASFAPSPLAGSDHATPSVASYRPMRSALARQRAAAPAAHSNRRSNLRFSTSTAETPMRMPVTKGKSLSASFLDDTSLPDDADDLNLVAHSSSPLKAQPSPPAVETDLEFTTISFAATSAQLADEEDRREASDERDFTGERISACEAAQREHDDPEQTLADLATEFLSTADMRAVMSQ